MLPQENNRHWISSIDANFRSWVQYSEFNLQVINVTEVLHKRTKARVNSNKENNDRTRTELNNSY
jgi:hypothetical protein